MIGGLSGVFMASTAVDVHIHDTYFIVAHIHYVLFGGSMFGIFGGIYFWYPKMFGRMMNETLGKIHFVLTFIFFNGTFFAMHILGIGGFPRRIADYLHYNTFEHFQPMNEFITWCAFGLGVSQIPVMEDGAPKGSLLESQLVDLILTHKDPKTVKVREIMGKPFPVVGPETPIEEVATLLKGETSAVLVKDKIGGLGILTKHDIIAQIAR